MSLIFVQTNNGTLVFKCDECGSLVFNDNDHLCTAPKDRNTTEMKGTVDMGIQQTNGDEDLRTVNIRMCPKFELSLEHWMWMHRLIGETQGTLTSIAMQSKSEEVKHFIAPCLRLEKDWDLFLEKIREAAE